MPVLRNILGVRGRGGGRRGTIPGQFQLYLQPYLRLDAKNNKKIPSLAQTSYLPAIYQKYYHIVSSMGNRLSINNVAVIEFTLISEYFKPYFGLHF